MRHVASDHLRPFADLQSTLEKVHEYAGELGLTDYRYFNLRDNDSDGGDLFSAVGLLRDDYSPKPAFDVLRNAVAATGVDAGARAGAPSPRPSAAGLVVRVIRRIHGVIVVSGRVVGAPCRGVVLVQIGRRSRRARVHETCVFRTRARVKRRRARVTATFGAVRVTRRV